MELWRDLLGGLGWLLSLFYDIIPSYGLAIILLTLTVRIALLPLTVKQVRSMQAMQTLQPEMKRLQQKYKDDRQKLHEEMSKLYRERGVNPFGGCLPLLLQLPVFFALYRVFIDCKKVGKKCASGTQGTIHLPAGSGLAAAIMSGQAGFFGMNLAISAVAAKGALNAAPYYLLVALMVVTTWWQQRQLQGTTAANPQTQLLGKIMPVFLGVISLNLPSGVLLYWVVSNGWTIGQQHFLLVRPKRPGNARAEDRKGAGRAPRKGGAKGESPGSGRSGGKK